MSESLVIWAEGSVTEKTNERRNGKTYIQYFLNMYINYSRDLINHFSKDKQLVLQCISQINFDA